MSGPEDIGTGRVRVCSVDDVPAGSGLTVQAAGHDVLLARVGDTLYAVDEECTHDGAPLSDGDLEEATIVCPWHFSRFCLRTGSVLESPAQSPLRTWVVEIVGSDVLLVVPVDLRSDKLVDGSASGIPPDGISITTAGRRRDV